MNWLLFGLDKWVFVFIWNLTLQEDGCNLIIGKDFIQMQQMLGSMNQSQIEKFKQDTCDLPQTIFSFTNLYPFLVEYNQEGSTIGNNYLYIYDWLHWFNFCVSFI